MLRTAKTGLMKLALLGAGILVSTGCSSESESPPDCSFGEPIACECPDGTQGAGLCGIDACDCSVTADTGSQDVIPTDVTPDVPDTSDAGITDTGGPDGGEVDTTPGTETICDDGLDDDLDGDTDCDDSDCASNNACVEFICNDGTDNDGDGDTDCADSDCEGVAACVESICTDGVDNDNDTLTDCEDPDCSAQLNCRYPPAWVAYTAQESSVLMALRIRSSDGLGEEYDIVPMGSQAIQGVAFSPDGRHLAYGYNASTNSGIRILNLETGDETSFTNGGPSLFRDPSWHPTEFAVVYSAGTDPNSASIWSYNMDTQTLGGPYASSNALGDPAFFVAGPAWNADASAIYVVAGVPGQIGVGDTRSDVAVLEGAGTNELRFLTTTLGVSGSITPNADNTRFVFHLGTGGCQTIDGASEAIAPVPNAFAGIDCSFLGDDRFVIGDVGNVVGGDMRVITAEGQSLAQLTETGTLRELNSSASSAPIDAFVPYFVSE